MSAEIDGVSINLSPEDLLALVKNLEILPAFKADSITLTVLESGDLNVLITKRGKENESTSNLSG